MVEVVSVEKMSCLQWDSNGNETMNELDSIQTTLQRSAGRRDQLQQQVTDATAQLLSLSQEQEDISRALEIIQQVAKLTQQQLEIHISELVSLALEAVFSNPYKMVLKFETRRNRSEADLLFQDETGNLLSPMEAVGGGVVDVAALALRIALWSLKRPRPRAVMIMDEPLRFLSSDLQDQASRMLKEISSKIGIQFLVVTHAQNLLEAADKVFEVKWEEGESKVEERQIVHR
jgi:DNA repair exonuclease SbcCD ATPase subunit